MGEGVR